MSKYLLKFKGHIVTLVIFLLIGNAAAIFVQFFRGNVLDAALAADKSNTIFYGVLMVSSIILEIAFYFLMFLIGGKLASKCVEKLKEDVFKTILNKNHKDFYSNDKSEYISKLSNDINIINDNYFLNFNVFCEVTLKATMVLISVIFLDWKLALITLFLMTLPLYVPKLIQKASQKTTSKYVQNLNFLMLKINDYLSGYEIIQNYSLSDRFIKKFIKHNREVQNDYYKMREIASASRSLSAILSYLSFFVVVMYSATQVLNHKFTAGEFFTAIGLIDQLSWPIISISANIHKFISIKPINTALTLFVKENNEDKKQEITTDINRITYENIGFSYDNKKLIENFNATFKNNCKYLIKGESGSGKTTLINLLLGYEKPDSGCISVDGKDLNEVNIIDHVSIVRQEAFLFSDSLRNNITLYDSIGDQTVLEALNIVNLKKFANDDGLEMQMENDGNNLSGGEKKRISLARAFVRQKNILILDEPLANLDNSNAGIIEDIILNIENTMVIVISHTFSEEKLERFDGIFQINKHL